MKHTLKINQGINLIDYEIIVRIVFQNVVDRKTLLTVLTVCHSCQLEETFIYVSHDIPIVLL